MRFFVVAFLVLLPSFIFSQVNTERYRKDYDLLGFSLTNTTGIDFSTGNTEEFEISEAIRLDWNNPIQDYYAVLEYDFKTANNKKTKDKGFVHFRTIRDFKESYLFGELFTQLEMDRFLNLRSRFLFGGGLRIDLITLLKEKEAVKANVKLFAGIGLMYENEVYSEEQTIYISHLRATSYISLIMALTENIDLGVVNYYQPAMENFIDYRFTSDIRLKIKLLDQLSLQFEGSYKHRNLVVDDTFKDDLEIKTSLVLRLP